MRFDLDYRSLLDNDVTVGSGSSRLELNHLTRLGFPDGGLELK
jgi:hypothetical protein